MKAIIGQASLTWAWARAATKGAIGNLRYGIGRSNRAFWVRLRLYLEGFVVFAVAFGFHAYLAPYGIDPHHDGIMFKPALDVSQGHMVFRDTFTQYGGVTVLLQAAALKVLGPRLLVIKLQTALMYGVGFLLFWRSWCRLVPSILATVVCIVGSVTGPDSIASSLPWSSVYAFAFQGLTLLLTIRYFERGKELELVFAGASAALAFWCRQPVGVLLAGGMLVALTLVAAHVTPNYARAPRSYSTRVVFGYSPLGRMASALVLFGAGLAGTNAAILLWLTANHAVVDWWKQSIVFARIWGSATGGGFALEQIIACLFPGGHLLVWCLMAVVIAVQAMRSTTVFLDPKSGARDLQSVCALLASTVAVTSWAQYYPVACDYHCYWGGIAMFGVFAYAFYATHRSSSGILRTSIAALVVAVVFYHDVDRRIEAIKPHIRAQDLPVTSVPALRGMRVNAADLASYDAVQSVIDAYLKTHPDGTIVTTAGHGLFPALTFKQAKYHPIYMSWVNIREVYPEADAARDRYVAEKLPMIIGPGEIPPTHIYVGHLSWQGVGYNILVPRDTNPTEIVECDVGGRCTRRAIQ